MVKTNKKILIDTEQQNVITKTTKLKKPRKINEPFDIFINRLAKKYTEASHLKEYLLEVFKSDTNDKLKLYRSAWRLIHYMHEIESYHQLEIFFKILRIFSTRKCICGQDAFVIIKSLLNDDWENFSKLTDYKEFWIYFHNLINLKLDKNIFKDPEMS